jgi:UPF0271 protein
MNTIDINCDMGESFGNYQIGNDREIFPYITSSNIACGFHGGDPIHMERAIKDAILHGVQVGAHPGFPDLAGFGRRKMDLPSDELKAIVKYQVSAIKGVAESLGTSVRYVKPHGALYNLAADDQAVSSTLVMTIREIDPGLMIMGLAGSVFHDVCNSEGMKFVAEAFADRKYEANGRLRSRSLQESVLTNPTAVTEQVMEIILNKQVIAHDGTIVPIEAQSLCIHGDNPEAVSILQAIDEGLKKRGILKQSFG